MSNSIIYEGFFIWNDLESKLSKDIRFKHITTEFMPKVTHEHLYGQIATFIVYAYGNDGVNEGYKVKLVATQSEELMKLYKKIEVPHITLSTSPEGKPINTRYLDFRDIDYDDKYVIVTQFGGFMNNRPYLYDPFNEPTKFTKDNIFEFFKEKYIRREDKEDFSRIGISDADFRQFIIDYLLGKDWYVVDPVDQEQTNEIALHEILSMYSKRYKKEIRENV